MGEFIIRRHDDGKYVAPAGSRHSYTADATKARRFPSREAAEADACGNESVVSLRDLLNL